MKSPLDDLTFDVVAVLHAKAKALEAYDKYLRDAEDDDDLHDLLVKMRHQDEVHVQCLKEVLARRLGDVAGEVEDEEGDFDDDADSAYEEDDLDEVEPSRDGGAGARGEASSREAGPMPHRGESTQRRI